jgi:hypothetical protein
VLKREPPDLPLSVATCHINVMPKGPQGQKRPADVVGNAVHVMRIATGEFQEKTPESEGILRDSALN